MTVSGTFDSSRIFFFPLHAPTSSCVPSCVQPMASTLHFILLLGTFTLRQLSRNSTGHSSSFCSAAALLEISGPPVSAQEDRQNSTMDWNLKPFLFLFFVAKLIINISEADILCLTSLENSSLRVEPLSFEERWEQVLESRRWMGEKKRKEKGRKKKKHSAWEPRSLAICGRILALHIDWWDHRRRTSAIKRESQISPAVFLVCNQYVEAEATYRMLMLDYVALTCFAHGSTCRNNCLKQPRVELISSPAFLRSLTITPKYCNYKRSVSL